MGFLSYQSSTCLEPKFIQQSKNYKYEITNILFQGGCKKAEAQHQYDVNVCGPGGEAEELKDSKNWSSYFRVQQL